MNIKVTRNHYSSCSPELDKRVPKGARLFFLGQCGLGDHALGSAVATDKGRIIGLLRYKLRGTKTFKSKGIWVDPAYRGQNLALRLFKAAMAKEGRTIIVGYSISEGGSRLLRRLQDNFKVRDCSPINQLRKRAPD